MTSPEKVVSLEPVEEEAEVVDQGTAKKTENVEPQTLATELAGALQKHEEGDVHEEEGGEREAVDEQSKVSMKPQNPLLGKLKQEMDGVSDSANLANAIQQLAKDNEVSGAADLGFSANEPIATLEQKFRQAAVTGAIKVMKAMLEMKLVDVNSCHAKTKQTALHMAAASGQVDSVNFLLDQQDINSDSKDIYSNTPVNLLPNGSTGAQLRKLFKHKLKSKSKSKNQNSNQKQSQNQGDESDENEIMDETEIIKKFGPVAALKPNSRYKHHVFLCHDYGTHKKCLRLKERLEKLNILVSMTSSLMTNLETVSGLINSSKLVVILSSKQLLSKLKDSARYETSSCVMEMNTIVDSKDVSQILIGTIDIVGGDIGKWEECYEFSTVVEEGLIFELSNEKLITENIPNLYNEIKVRAT